MHEPTVIDPPYAVEYMKEYDSISGYHWACTLSRLKELMQLMKQHEAHRILYEVHIIDWIERRIAYLEMKELLENAS